MASYANRLSKIVELEFFSLLRSKRFDQSRPFLWQKSSSHAIWSNGAHCFFFNCALFAFIKYGAIGTHSARFFVFHVATLGQFLVENVCVASSANGFEIPIFGLHRGQIIPELESRVGDRAPSRSTSGRARPHTSCLRRVPASNKSTFSPMDMGFLAHTSGSFLQNLLGHPVRFRSCLGLPRHAS